MTRTYRKSGKYFYVVSDTTISMGSSGSRTMYGISIIGEHNNSEDLLKYESNIILDREDKKLWIVF